MKQYIESEVLEQLIEAFDYLKLNNKKHGRYYDWCFADSK